jgi:hypothetical protein
VVAAEVTRLTMQPRQLRRGGRSGFRGFRVSLLTSAATLPPSLTSLIAQIWLGVADGES